MNKRVLVLNIFAAIFLAVIFFGCSDDNPSENNPGCIDTGNVYIEAPYLYIYPEEETDLAITISFPEGGYVTESEPVYGNGWSVNVAPTGLINGQYRFLFYETYNPDLTQKKRGYVVKRENLESFFVNNMRSSGFSEAEITDFTEYWIPELTEYPYYELYPQYNGDIDKMILLDFSVVPDRIMRLTYLVKGRKDNNINLLPPQIHKIERKGFYIFEWGVILK